MKDFYRNLLYVSMTLVKFLLKFDVRQHGFILNSKYIYMNHRSVKLRCKKPRLLAINIGPCPSFSLGIVASGVRHANRSFPPMLGVFQNFLRQCKENTDKRAKGSASIREEIPVTYGTSVSLDGRLSRANIYPCKFLVMAEAREGTRF